ncbi:MAG: agmatine deiminase family protein [Tannerellaceae bacterium]|jgi:agmatine/peptidylarginine deiminase|nr:agmatine deiminase family protein [Tannerellaceae bacterium]
MGRLLAEWEAQEGVMMAWPDEEMDWGEDTEEARDCYRKIIGEIVQREGLTLLCRDRRKAEREYGCRTGKGKLVHFVELPLDDTWTRDYAPLTVEGNKLVDFRFDGWGGKFEATADDATGGRLFRSGGVFAPSTTYLRREDLVCEGGNMETDGKGTLLTSAICAERRHPRRERLEMEAIFAQTLGISRTLWVEYGLLEGDDTDGHIDTLVRFADAGTLLYTSCKPSDSHFTELKRMEEQLRSFRQADGRPYRLVALPLPSLVVYRGERLPATYANFLFINGAVLAPVYGIPEDVAALEVFRHVFPNREVRGIDCRALLRQHGSLHCATMQFPRGMLLAD